MHYNRIVLNEPHASIEGLYNNQLSFLRYLIENLLRQLTH